MQYLILAFTLITGALGQSLYEIEEKGIDGKPFKLNKLKGEVVLIVNIASQCGYTPQLKSLETLYRKYKAKNFTVLGVPTNDFGGQTPEDDKSMQEFCSKNYDVSFPLLSKKTIQGKEKRELYRFLTEQTPKKFQGEVGWNFEKFLINREGKVVGRMRSSLDPMDKKLRQQIEDVL